MSILDWLESAPLTAKRTAPPDEPVLSVDDVCKMADNGDIILFSGESEFSGLVTLFCGSQWSHIGIVYRSASGESMLFESVKSDENKSKPTGVRLLPLRSSLESFRGKSMALRCLCIPSISVQRDETITRKWRLHLQECMAECVRLYKGKQYEDRIVNFIFARFTSFIINYETRDRLFCSELVAICYQTMGILEDHHSCIQFIPDDFCEAGSVPLTMPAFIDLHTVQRAKVKLGIQMFIRKNY